MLVYSLTSPSGKRYIGQTVQSLTARWWQHRHNAKRGVKSHLYTAMRKYGADQFMVREVWRCDSRDHLDVMEEHFVAAFGDYNLKAGGTSGYRHSAETLEKMSAAKRGKKLSAERRKAMSEAQQAAVARRKKAGVAHGNKGRAKSAAHRKAMSEARMGKPWSAERRARFEKKKLDKTRGNQ